MTTITYSAAFPNGVSAGDVTQTTAWLWTRAADLGRLTLQISTDASFSRIVKTQRFNIKDGSVPVKVEIDGLNAGTEYFYRFIDASGDVITGSFSTAASPGTSSGFHFGVVSDAHGADRAPFMSISNAAGADLDLLIKLGDQAFADQPPPGAATLAEFLAEHQAVYSASFGFNFFADLQAKTPILAMLDDAELRNNWAGGAAPASDPRFAGQSGDFINETTLYRNALDAFRAYNAIDDSTYRHTGNDLFNGTPDLYRYQTYGSDAAVIMVDARSFRDVELDSPVNPLDAGEVVPFIAASFDPTRSMLGETQFERIKQDLLDARDQGLTWKFVVLPEPIQNYGPIVDAGDRFEGYAAERAKLLAFIDENHIENVVFVSGDTHWLSVNNLTYQKAAFGPQIASTAFEVVVPSVAGDLIGPLVAPTAAAFGLITPEQLAFYESLPVAPDGDSFLNDKDDFNEFILNTVLTSLGYDPLGLDNNIADAAGKIDATLLQGSYFVSHHYGWTDFDVDATTGKLMVTTWGVPGYTEADLAADPAAVLSLVPSVVSQFEVTPTSGNILGTSGKDHLNGTNGDDVILGAAGNDKLIGGVGADYLDGGVGDDSLEGGQGDDILYGRAGNDLLNGGAGNDTLSGGEGRDTLFGGDGNDVFVFGPDSGRTSIQDFDADPAGGQDFLDISAFGITAADFAQRVKIQDIGNDTRVIIDGNASEPILLVGVKNAAIVTEADFLL